MIVLRFSLILIFIGIAYLSLTPSTSVSVGNDKLGHFIAYGALMFNLGLLAFDQTRKFLLSMLLALCYGALMEWGQSFVPGRSVSLYDMFANAGGVAIGSLLAYFFGARIRSIFTSKRRK